MAPSQSESECIPDQFVLPSGGDCLPLPRRRTLYIGAGCFSVICPFSGGERSATAASPLLFTGAAGFMRQLGRVSRTAPLFRRPPAVGSYCCADKQNQRRQRRVGCDESGAAADTPRHPPRQPSWRAFVSRIGNSCGRVPGLFAIVYPPPPLQWRFRAGAVPREWLCQLGRASLLLDGVMFRLFRRQSCVKWLLLTRSQRWLCSSGPP